MLKNSNKTRINKDLVRNQRGSMLAWIVILTAVSIGMASLVVDVGFIQRERARMQQAVDASALAGPKQLPNEDMSLIRARDLAFSVVLISWRIFILFIVIT